MPKHQSTAPRRHRLRELMATVLKFIFNPRLLFCFGVAWFITNGWSYVLLGVGSLFGISWMIAVASFYLTLLWFPFTPEKLITLAIAMWLLTCLFPDDQRTLSVLKDMSARTKAAINRRRQQKALKKQEDTKKPPNE